MNYSQKVLFDNWIKNCQSVGVYVDEPVSKKRWMMVSNGLPSKSLSYYQCRGLGSKSH